MRDALTIFYKTVAFCGTDVKYQDVLRNLNVLDYEYSFSLVDAFLKGDYPSALLTFDEILTKGFNALHFVAALSSHMRDLIVSKSGGLGALLELPESLKKKYKEQADRCPLPFLYEGLSITTQCESGYRASVNPRLHIEFALMKLSFICNKEAVAASVAAPAAQPVPAPQPAPVPAPVAQPAPAPAPAVQPVAAAPAAEEQPRERRQRSSRGAAAALTMKAVMDDKPVAETVVENANVPLPSDELLKAKWPELAQMYAAKQPRLASMLSSSALAITSDEEYKTVVFRVVNEAQKDWVESKLLHDLEGNYRKLLGSMKVYLRVSVTPEEAVQEKVAYMPSDQAKELMANNEEVKSLVKDLGLDIK